MCVGDQCNSCICRGGEGEKYSLLDWGYFFQPVALENTSAVGPDSVLFMKVFRIRIRRVIGEVRSFVFLMQKLSVGVQTGNAISVLGTLGFSDLSEDCCE